MTRTLSPESQISFRFALIGDRTGARRPGVFANGIQKLELFKPDFVISIGDLVEGYTEDEAEILRQWEEVEQRLQTLSMPLFFIAGNHDYSNQTMARIWEERRGAPYWSFMHKDVLILGLSTEDPPIVQSPETIASGQRLANAMEKAPEQTQEQLLNASRNRGNAPSLPGDTAISDKQVAFALKELSAHSDARWVFVIMHKPAWKYNNPQFAQIEQALAGRPYTVIAGHEHYYSHETRLGRDYIILGTTGGVWLQDGPGKTDHLTMVSMAPDGPSFANIKLDGIFDKTGNGL